MSHPLSPTPSAPAAPLPWEPALTQLRELEPAALDTLITGWLTTLGLTDIRVRQHQGGSATYQAILGRPPLATPVHVRLHQRRNQLQAHHVDAFRGALLRQGIPGGLLITTGDCSREARLIAGLSQTPQICLLSGEQWTALLAARRTGLRSVRLPRWTVDFQRLLRCANGRSSSSPRRGDGCP